jgi:hypothetical protein
VGGLEDGIDDPELHTYFSEFGFVTRALRYSVPANHCASYQCCGSGMFITDPNFFYPGSEVFCPGSRICIKGFEYFKQKKVVSKLSEI